MTNEKQEKDKQVAKQPEAPKTFVEALGVKYGYPYYFEAVSISMIDHPDPEFVCYGFQTANGVKIQAVTLPKARALLWARAVLKEAGEKA
jgi:hypothetical protein